MVEHLVAGVDQALYLCVLKDIAHFHSPLNTNVQSQQKKIPMTITSSTRSKASETKKRRGQERSFMIHTQSRPCPDIKNPLHLFLLQRRIIQPAPNRLDHHRMGQIEPIHLGLERSQLTALVDYMD